MYTVYVNDCPLYLVGPDDQELDHDFQLRYAGKPKFFLQVTGTLEGGAHPGGVVVRTRDLEEAWADFRKHFRWVQAAGGAVLNGDRLLCIRRLGRWDLPKGKLDPGEGRERAAVREVMEETGLQDVHLRRPLATTYHTYYTRKGNRVLKPTYWYEMQARQTQLTPQAEESIEEARWVPREELGPIRADMYPSLHEVLDALDA